MSSNQIKRLFLLLTLTWLFLAPCVGAISDTSPVTHSDNDFILSEVLLSEPADLQFENGSTGEEIVWNATVEDPRNFTVTRNGDEYDSGNWNGEDIEVDLDHLYDDDLIVSLPVTFTFVCTVFNMDNESDFDSVDVTVIADEVAPIISATGNFTYEEGSFGHEVVFNITETNPDTYNITRQSNWPTDNFTVLEDGDWDGRNFTLDVDGLNATHWYLYTLFVNDTLGQSSTSVVNVSVYPDLTAPVVDSPDDVVYEFGAEGNSIIWNIYDSNPKNYTIEVTILFNDTTYGNTSAFHGPANITQEDWSFDDPDGQDLGVTLDYLYLGNYTYTLTLFDDYGYNSTDSVNVSIYKDVRAPEVDALDEFEYEEGYTGYSLNWSADESNPKSYNLTLDGEVLMNGTWYGENLTTVVDGLAVGEYTYNMTLIDFFNQSISFITELTVFPDAHDPIVNQVRALQTFSSELVNNLTIQAYVWDLNNISGVSVEWYTTSDDENNTIDMEQIVVNTQSADLYISELGEFNVGDTVHYRVIAIDNSSVSREFSTQWFEIEIERLKPEATPVLLWGSLLGLGLLTTLVLLVLYFKTKTR